MSEPQQPTMSGEQMLAIRTGLGLTRVQFGLAIGYSGDRNTVNDVVRKYEQDVKPIPPWIATTARALDVDGILEFIQRYNGADDRAEFARHLGRYLTQGA